MFQKIKDFSLDEGALYWALGNGTVGVSYFMSQVDGESPLPETVFRELLNSLPDNVFARFLSFSNFINDGLGHHSRAKEIKELGQTKDTNILSFEIQQNRMWKNTSFKALINELKSKLDLSLLKNEGVKLKSLNQEELTKLIENKNLKHITKTNIGLDFSSHILGISRLEKQSSYNINQLTFSSLRHLLPQPFSISCTVKKLPKHKSEVLLRRKSSQAFSSDDKIATTKYVEAQNRLENIALFGSELFEFELYIMMPRLKEEELRIDLENITHQLRPLGDFYTETIGAHPSYLSTLFGHPQHSPILEETKPLTCYLPVVVDGEAQEVTAKPGDLLVHRTNDSVTNVDLFNPSYNNYSACICGTSGRGKSVLTNLLTRALYNDENNHIIKIDVGGSHSKETELLGGTEYLLSLDKPSGINPFEALKIEHSENICNILSSFLNTLILEEGEFFLSKQIRSEVELAIKSYSLSRPENPSLKDFVENQTSFPRRDLLKRWTEGTFKNAFLKSNKLTSHSRLSYYNFSQIFQASDPDFAQGGLAAVMAQFNLDLMNSKGKRLIFIADETPFFIERCFSFFKFSTANVRKYGGSFITIAQKTSDLVINNDTGILENSNTKFLFSVDGDKESFSKRLNIPIETVNKIESLQNIKGVFSECLQIDGLRQKTLRIHLTPEEYWRFTSSREDSLKLKKLMESVPGITLNEAIKCLSL